MDTEIRPKEETSSATVSPGSPDDKLASEKANLARYMAPEMLKRIGGKCCERYTNDVGSRAERMKKLKLLQKMYALVAEAKSFPFQNAANVKTPALTGPQLQIQARLYDMMVPATGKIFTVIPGSPAESMAANVAEKFANNYLRYKMPYLSQGLYDTIHQKTLYGSAFRRTYWDGYERKVRSDWIPIEDFVVYAKQRSQDPSMSDVPRYTMVHHWTPYDIKARGEDGYLVNYAAALSTAENEGQSEFADQAEKIDGVSVDEQDDDAPRQVLEQHCKWKLPNQPGTHPAFDGKEHWVVITIDAATEQVMRLCLREEDDPDDARRFERDSMRFAQYLQQLETYTAGQSLTGAPEAAPPAEPMMPPPGEVGMGPADMPEMSPEAMPMGEMMGMGGDAGMMGMGGGMGSSMPMAGMPMQPAIMKAPEPVAKPRPMRKRQICFFTHYRCFASDGFYGLGYGDVLYGIALAMNTLVNQHIDGVTLRNAKPGFISRNARGQRGAINIQPGTFTEIDAPMGSIRDAIMFLDPPMNDPTTMPLVKMLDDMKDSMVGSSDLMSGQSPGSNQTKAGMQILAEQAMTPITVLARQTREELRHDLDKMWRCFGVFLDDEELVDIVGDGGQPEQITIGRGMFTPSTRLVPASDPRIKSQRVEDHMALFTYCMNNPFVSQGPAGPQIMAKLTEEGFRIFPDGERLIPLLQPPAPPPPQPKPQWAENAGFMRGEDSPVLPDDDDDQHMNEMMGFFQSPDAAALDDKGRQLADNHFRGHIAQRMMKRGMANERAQAEMGGIGGGGPPGMVQPPSVGPALVPPGGTA